MKILLVFVLAAALLILAVPKTFVSKDEQVLALQKQQLNTFIRGFLITKKSPLASETDFLLQQKHWKLLIAISAIESQYCKIQIGLNCWGITKFHGGYRKYSSLQEGIRDANNLIERWQQKGKWLTVESMNGSYVVPKNPNWVFVVNKVLREMNEYERQSSR